jgi:hypothetical protein
MNTTEQKAKRPKFQWQHCFINAAGIQEDIDDATLRVVINTKIFKRAADDAEDQLLNALDKEESNTTASVSFDLPDNTGGKWLFKVNLCKLPEVELYLNSKDYYYKNNIKLPVTEEVINQILEDVNLK